MRLFSIKQAVSPAPLPLSGLAMVVAEAAAAVAGVPEPEQVTEAGRTPSHRLDFAVSAVESCAGLATEYNAGDARGVTVLCILEGIAKNGKMHDELMLLHLEAPMMISHTRYYVQGSMPHTAHFTNDFGNTLLSVSQL